MRTQLTSILFLQWWFNYDYQHQLYKIGTIKRRFYTKRMTRPLFFKYKN